MGFFFQEILAHIINSTWKSITIKKAPENQEL